ncbi:DUF1294 domain-containing protein [Paenibacillus rubinfantis]|uniref:DUF1294 domain-containing protein n=1 Tax=Paenibacillus rubinfantis TaxID=1720296 RepID=UPI0009EC7C96|nr:DUF1294 domain-containing protein [Paenibacillus rubinfantis]
MFNVVGYIAILNIIGLLIMWYDKSQAVVSGRRVPEKRIFFICLLGGSFGVWIGMRLFRHKTKHYRFVFGVPLILILNMICFYFLMIGKP